MRRDVTRDDLDRVGGYPSFEDDYPGPDERQAGLRSAVIELMRPIASRLRINEDELWALADAALAAQVPAQEERPEMDAVYAERNRLVAALAHLFANAAWRGLDPDAPDFTVVYIDLPTGQVSWHVPDAEMEQFPPLSLRDPTGWDGHDPDEKYKRLGRLRRGDICRDVQEAVERALASSPPVPAQEERLDVSGRGPRDTLTDALMRGPGRYSRSGSQALAERLLLALEDAGYVIGEARP